MLNQYRSSIVLKIIVIATLLLGLSSIITPQKAFADSCSPSSPNSNSPGGGMSFCVITGGAGVTAQRPALNCTLVGANGNANILQGCDGSSNFEKVGFGNNNGRQQWVVRYGWTYSGTGDGLRYFTFNNYTYFAPMDTTKWVITYSDGNEFNNSCAGGGSCNYNAWNNYIADWHSPTAQFRDWVTVGRPNVQSELPLEAPQPGLINCQGSQQGSSTKTLSASLNVTGNNQAGGTIGYTSSSNVAYFADGQCNAGTGVDIYSTYMNLNWNGGFQNLNCNFGVSKCASTTTSALNFLDVTAYAGPNGNGSTNPFGIGWNLTVNWWNLPGSFIENIDLHGNINTGPNTTFMSDEWFY